MYFISLVKDTISFEQQFEKLEDNAIVKHLQPIACVKKRHFQGPLILRQKL